MSFWEEHEAREQAEARAKTLAARHPQDAPAACTECPHVGADVMYGLCSGCDPYA